MRLLTAFFLLLSSGLYAQSKYATVSGRVTDANDRPIKNVSVVVLGKNSGSVTSDSGTFSIKVPAQRAFALIFSHSGFAEQQRNFSLSTGEQETVDVQLAISTKTLETVTVADQKERKETGLVKIDAQGAVLNPSTVGGVEGQIKTLVGSNNELSSQYSVRGGNFDENLVYINGYEIYRPYLVSSGQQEGLSFINPELTGNINFYTGGFPALYGDKMSSVLDIQYKRPVKFGGSAYMSLLEQGLELEGNSRDGKFTYVAGARNKSNENLLSSQPTTGSYIPSASDLQALLGYKISDKLKLELLSITSASRFSFYPESVKKTAAVFSPAFTEVLGLDVFFNGQEHDRYATSLTGLTLLQTINNRVRLRWMVSRFSDVEKQNEDIGGAYLFGDRDFDHSSETYGQITNPLGAGYDQDYSRDRLNIDVYSFAQKGSYESGEHLLQWGLGVDETRIKAHVAEFEYRDSAGYSLPYSSNGPFALFSTSNTDQDFSFAKYTGYIQDNIHFLKSAHSLNLTAGARLTYDALNKEFLASPRAELSWKPWLSKDFLFKAAAGVYDQPPFFREMLSPTGTLNTGEKAQKSKQFVTGFDYQFTGANQMPMRFTTEAYYKSMTDVIPYDIDNVKIRYLGRDDAKAYAAGVEFRLFGELVKDAQSWVSLGLMHTKENLSDDYYYSYRNASGETITAASTDQVATDSTKNSVGYVRRPTDRFITVGMYLEDYLPTNKNFKLHLNAVYGSNMSYNVPGSVEYRNGLTIPAYIRVDVGFSVLLLGENSIRRSHSPFRSFKNIWASLEVFNLIDRDNTISYQLIKDFSNTVYAIPNRLTPRLLNFKIVGRF